MIVVLNAEIALLLAAHANNQYDERRISPATEPRFASWNTLTSNFYRSLDCARKNESIIYFPMIC